MNKNAEFSEKEETLSGAARLFVLVLFWNSLLYFFLRDKLSPVTDFVNYYSPLAVNLLSGKGYALEGGLYTHHPPLFPVVLAVCYKLSGVWGMQNILYPVLVLLLQSLSAVTLYRLTRRILCKETAVFSMILFAVHPFFVVLTATQYIWTTMPLALFCFISSAERYFFASEQRSPINFFVSGFFAGLAGLAWAGMAYVFMVFLFDALIKSFRECRGWIFSLLFLLGFLVPAGGWSIYASWKTDQKLFISSASNLAVADGIIRHDYSKLRKYAFVQRTIEKEKAGQFSTSQQQVHFYMQELKNFPSDFVKWAAYKAARAWYGTDSEQHEGLNLAAQTPYLIMGFWGLISLFLKRRKEACLLLGIILYFWAISFVTLSTIRYMMPAFMIWIIFSAHGVQRLWEKLKLRV